MNYAKIGGASAAAQEMAYAAQTMPGTARAGEEHLGRIGARLQELQVLVHRIGNFTDRLSGPVPADAKCGPTSPPASSDMTAQLSLLHEMLSSLEADLRPNVERLERFF